MSNRLRSIGTNPTIRNFARDASQAAIRKTADFLAPTVEVPTLTGQYKVYDAKNRYRRPNASRAAGGRATVIGFTAKDALYKLEPKALDFHIPDVETYNDEGLLDQAKYGASLLADAAGLDHEMAVIETALASLGAGTEVNFAAADFDPIKYLSARIREVQLLAKNGARIKMLVGPKFADLLVRNKYVVAQFGSTPKAVRRPTLEDIAALLPGNPAIMESEMVYDAAPEGKEEDMKFLLDADCIIFASNDTPNTMDPSFMKTFRLMGKWMVPGSYQTQDGRDEFLKMDWIEGVMVTNPAAAKRLVATEVAPQG